MSLTDFESWWKYNGIELATYAEKMAAKKGWIAAIETEVTKPKSAASAAIGPCNCDPHIETCDQCAPYLHTVPPYEAWRISYQSSEQAARAAYKSWQAAEAKIAELESDLDFYRNSAKASFERQLKDQAKIADLEALVTAENQRKQHLENQLAQAVAREREACAKTCEKYGASLNNEWNQSLGFADDLVETCEECAEAIRARSNA